MVELLSVPPQWLPGPGFVIWHKPKSPSCLCHLSGLAHAQRLHMQCIQNMGQPSCDNGQEVQRQPLLMREQCSHLHGLAKSSRLLQFQAQCQTHLFRLQYCLSQSSELSSSTEGLGHILPTSQMCRNMHYKRQVSHRNTHTLSLAFVSASASVSLPLSPLNHHLTKNLSLSLWMNSTRSFTMKYGRVSTLAQFVGRMSKPSLAHSRPFSIIPKPG